MSMPRSLNIFLLYVDMEKGEMKKKMYLNEYLRRKKIIGAGDNPIRFSQIMLSGDEGQQELFSTVLRANEADKKNGNSLRQKFEDFDEDQKEKCSGSWVVSQQEMWLYGSREDQ